MRTHVGYRLFSAPRVGWHPSITALACPSTLCLTCPVPHPVAFCVWGGQDLVAENAAEQKELAELKQDGSRTRDRILMRNFIKDDSSDRADAAGTGVEP